MGRTSETRPIVLASSAPTNRAVKISSFVRPAPIKATKREKMHAREMLCAALTADGAIVAWGDENAGGATQRRVQGEGEGVDPVDIDT